MDLCQLPGLMTQASRLAKLEHVQHRTRAASVWTVEHAGILKLNLLYTVNIKMWYHPKYYKELRKLRNKLDQAIRLRESETSTGDRSPGPGLKQQGSGSSHKQQADKAQATETQASSSKR